MRPVSASLGISLSSDLRGFQISIPIHTVVEGTISLPVSLNYHAGGVRVAENGSWAGLGWSVNAGGMVSRSVLGRPDERSNGYLTIGSTIALPPACTNSPLIGEIATGTRTESLIFFPYR